MWLIPTSILVRRQKTMSFGKKIGNEIAVHIVKQRYFFSETNMIHKLSFGSAESSSC